MTHFQDLKSNWTNKYNFKYKDCFLVLGWRSFVVNGLCFRPWDDLWAFIAATFLLLLPAVTSVNTCSLVQTLHHVMIKCFESFNQRKNSAIICFSCLLWSTFVKPLEWNLEVCTSATCCSSHLKSTVVLYRGQIKKKPQVLKQVQRFKLI